MTTVGLTPFLGLLATTPASGVLSMIAAKEAVIVPEEASHFQDRLKEQVVGVSSPFFGKVDQLRRVLKSTSGEKRKQIPTAKIQAATAWNDLNPQLKLDAQIAAAQVTAEYATSASMVAAAAEDHGVIGPYGEEAQRFHDYDVSIVVAVNSTGPLGTVALLKLLKNLSVILGSEIALNWTYFGERAEASLGVGHVVGK